LQLATERLVLRLPTPADAPAFVEFLTDAEVMRFLGGVVPRDAAPAVVQQWIDAWEANGIGKFVVERRTDGAIVGRVGLNVCDDRTWEQTTFAAAGEHAQPEVAWGLARAHWGHGYAVEAAAAARDWGQSKRGLTGLVSLVAPDNERSAAVAARLGARRSETVDRASGGQLVIWVHP
jgi:RimJ/RimL family protein N-acetyltransferase